LSILRYNNKLFRAFKNLIFILKLSIFIIKLSIFIVTFYRKIQGEQRRYNRLIVFFATSLILINSIISRFRKKNLKSLITNKE